LKRHTRLAALIALASCLGASACGSLLGLGDLPALDAGAGSALDGEAIVVESGSASEGGPTEPVEASAPVEASPDASPTEASTAPKAGADTGTAIDAAMGMGPDSGADTGSSPPPPVCTDGTTQCVSSTEAETCGSDGQWGAPTTCEYVCAGGNCGGVCTPDATQCSGESVETCSSEGQWETSTTCSGGQTCSTSTGTAACACPSGESNCSGTCVDLSTGTPGVAGLGPTNCGTCGAQCEAEGSCNDGTCCGPEGC
jgi:hypothetical protein